MSALCSYFNGLFCFRTCALQVACVAGGILVPVEPFLTTEPPCEVSGEAARENPRFKLTCIPTLLTAPPPKQYSTPTHIPPATQATLQGPF